MQDLVQSLMFLSVLLIGFATALLLTLTPLPPSFDSDRAPPSCSAPDALALRDTLGGLRADDGPWAGLLALVYADRF